MKITPDVFEAYLKCPTKCWLRSTGETSAGNTYSEWVKTQNDSYRTIGTERLLAEFPKDEVVLSPDIENVKGAKWRLGSSLAVQTQMDSCVLESELHAVERMPAEGQGKPVQFIPIRFLFTNKLNKDDKLLLALDAFALSKSLGREVSVGRIIHGDDHATLKVKTSAMTSEVRKRIEKIAALLANPTPPDLVLNRHCAECEFQARCKQKAVEKDDLSLLSNMPEKERTKLHRKGIFTVTQLSYTFRPRRRPKKLRDKREKYHHSLKALAIREKKIHIVGTPELKLEGTPVYLDVEGLPDRDFYYLIGVRIGNGDTALHHSVWANDVGDEKRIWQEFISILATIEKPILIHYGSYETTFLKRMSERYGSPPKASAASEAIGSTVNLLSFIYAQIYFPTFSNGLKEIGKWLGSHWSENEPSGLKAIAWRHKWESSLDQALKTSLVDYNADDCRALEEMRSLIVGISLARQTQDADSNIESQIIRAEQIKDDRLQKWREFKSTIPEFEAFTKAAHWNYQHDRVNIQCSQRPKRPGERPSRAKAKPKIYREVISRTSRICPRCKKRKRSRCIVKTRYRYELFTGRSSLKVRLIKYVFQTYFCRRCNLTFGEDAHFRDLHKFGWSLASFLVYQVIGLNIPQRKVAQSFSRLFGIPISVGALHGLKCYVANYYRETRQQILNRIARGSLAHVDETRIHLQKSSGYVWVLTSLKEVAYVFSESREAELPKGLLSEFGGVLVSDFYAAYDSLNCKHQRCLIHLIRTLNDEALEHPFDEELKSIVVSYPSDEPT